MLVYANHLEMEGSAASEAAFRAIGGWLKEQLGFGLMPEKLRRRGEYRGNRGDAQSWLRVYGTSEESPEYYAWILKITDSQVRGRQWITELGVRVAGDSVDMSCVVKTDELSTLVVQPAMASQPRVIRYLVNNINASANGEFAASVPGVQLKTVGQDKDSYRGLRGYIEHSEREFSIVLVSPDTFDRYLVDPADLQEKVFGLAQVVKVSSGYNSFDMEEVLGQGWSAWNGAVNVIHTRTRSGLIPKRLFLSSEIESLGSSGLDRVSHVLATVTAHTNVPRLRKRIRPEGVAQISLRRHLQRLHLKSSKMGAAEFRRRLVRLAEEVQKGDELISDLDSYNDGLEAEKEDLAASLDGVRDALRRKEYEIQGLKDTLEGLGRGRTTSVDVDFLVQLICRNDEPSPEDCLQVVQSLYGDRCVILESAWESASKMNLFGRGRYLLDRLIRLVTVYKDELVRAGDSKAKQCFGTSEFAATESETITSNKALVRARTFEYGGERIAMFRHLKIGVADDQTKTIRIHFHWDSEKQKIVIGHCGEHLPILSR